MYSHEINPNVSEVSGGNGWLSNLTQDIESLQDDARATLSVYNESLPGTKFAVQDFYEALEPDTNAHATNRIALQGRFRVAAQELALTSVGAFLRRSGNRSGTKYWAVEDPNQDASDRVPVKPTQVKGTLAEKLRSGYRIFSPAELAPLDRSEKQFPVGVYSQAVYDLLGNQGVTVLDILTKNSGHFMTVQEVLDIVPENSENAHHIVEAAVGAIASHSVLSKHFERGWSQTVSKKRADNYILRTRPSLSDEFYRNISELETKILDKLNSQQLPITFAELALTTMGMKPTSQQDVATFYRAIKRLELKYANHVIVNTKGLYPSVLLNRFKHQPLG